MTRKPSAVGYLSKMLGNKLHTNQVQVSLSMGVMLFACASTVPKKMSNGQCPTTCAKMKHSSLGQDHYFGSKKSRRGGHTALSTSCLVVSRPW